MPIHIDPQRQHAEKELAAAKKELREMSELCEAPGMIQQAAARVRRAELAIEQIDATAAELRPNHGFPVNPSIGPLH